MNYVFYVFWFTVKQAALSTLFTIPLAVLMARAIVWNHTWWPARFCLKLLGLPLITPALVGILGFITLIGGLFNIYSLAGIVAVHVVFYSPWIALLLVNAWRLIPEEQYRVASQLHFSSKQTFYFVEWPQLRKSLSEVAWICFCFSLNSFTTIMVLGGGPQKTTLSAGLYHSLFFFYDVEQVTWFVSLQLILTLSLAVLTIFLKTQPQGVSLKRPCLPNIVLLQAGLAQTPAAVTFLVIARSAAALLPRTGVRPLVVAGSGCFLGGFGWLTQAHADAGYFTGLLGPTLLIAIGIGLTFPTLMAAATADVPPRDAGIIGGLANTTSQVGGSIGLAVLASAASARASTEAGGSFPAAALAAGYDLVFLVASGLGLAIALVSGLLPRHRRATTTPRPTVLGWCGAGR